MATYVSPVNTVKLDGSGNGQCFIAPPSGTVWSLRLANVSTTGTVKQPQCFLYRGSFSGPLEQIDSTYLGNSASSGKVGGTPFFSGQVLWAKWVGGDANAVATLQAYGTQAKRGELPFDESPLSEGFPLNVASVFQAGNTIINSAGEFVYSAAPATGDLIASITGASGTDQFSNAYDAGVYVYNATSHSGLDGPSGWLFLGKGLGTFAEELINGNSLQLVVNDVSPPASTVLSLGSPNGGGLLNWNGAGGVLISGASGLQVNHGILVPAGGLTVSAGGAAVTGASSVNGNLVVGAASETTAAALEIHSLEAIATQAAPGTPPSGFTYVYANSTDNFLHYKDVGGFDGTIPATSNDTTDRTVTQAASTQLGGNFSIPANDAPVGTCYRYHAGGTGTWGSTQQQLTLIDSLTATNVNQLNVAAAAFAISTPFDWDLWTQVVIKTTGVSGTCNVRLALQMSVNNAAALTTNGISAVRRTAGVAINTTVANSLQLNALWAATTGAPTITCNNSTFERIGP